MKYKYVIKEPKDGKGGAWTGTFDTLKQAREWYNSIGYLQEEEYGIELILRETTK